jgi:hypothetical protein
VSFQTMMKYNFIHHQRKLSGENDIGCILHCKKILIRLLSKNQM